MKVTEGVKAYLRKAEMRITGICQATGTGKLPNPMGVFLDNASFYINHTGKFELYLGVV